MIDEFWRLGQIRFNKLHPVAHSVIYKYGMRAREIIPSIIKEDAWHGSKHEFDKFSIDYIGNGEGNQTFGWGLYFTDTQEIADWYRDRLTPPMVLLLNGKKYEQDDHALLYDLTAAIIKAVPPKNTHFNSGKETYRYYLNEITNALILLIHYRSQKELLDKWKVSWLKKSDPYEDEAPSVEAMVDAAVNFFDGMKYQRLGKVYKVSIPSSDAYLLWDSDIGEQPPKVQKILKSIVKETQPEVDFSNMMYDYSGEDIYRNLSKKLGSAKDASLLLAKYGIVGIKYFDGLSRDGSRTTFNYVIFDDSHVQMTESVKMPNINNLGRPITSPEAISNFWKWFKGSKIVDKSGRPIVVHHGTKQSFKSFDPKRANHNTQTGVPHSAFVFTNCPNAANSYAGQKIEDWGFENQNDEDVYKKLIRDNDIDGATKYFQTHAVQNAKQYSDGGNIMPVYLKAKKVLRIDAKGDNWKDIYFQNDSWTTNELMGYAMRKGYDGLVIKNVHDRQTGRGEASDVYVVFDPSQIKSAVGNNGSFGANNLIDEEID